jgi:hypothetical protein
MISIPARFNGPPGSANGGYAAGLVAEAVGPSAAVRLLLPPPLDVPLERRRDDDGVVRLRAGETTIAEGRPGRPGVQPPAPPDLAAAAGVEYVGRQHHPFPTCFVCGPSRAADGLGVFPGRVGDQLACAWRPTAEFAGPRFVWAALDCPSGFACMPSGSRTVLASMTANLEAAVEPDTDYVITAWRIASEGRKHRAGSALHDADGRRIAVAEALWITLREPGSA